MDSNSKRGFLTIGIVIVVVGIFAYYTSHDFSCEIRFDNNEPPIVTLFKFAKENGYCSKYTVLDISTDSYGNKKWIPVGYYSFSRKEYDELIKYSDGYTYLDSYKNLPQFISSK